MLMRRRNLLIVCAILALALCWALVAQASPPAAPVWCYDLNTGTLFAAPEGRLPPFAAPSGDLAGAPPDTPAGVLAMVIRPSRTEPQRIVYLQSYDADTKAALQAAADAGRPDAVPLPMVMKGTLVAVPPASPGAPVRWLPMTSPEGGRIVSNLPTSGYIVDSP